MANRQAGLGGETKKGGEKKGGDRSACAESRPSAAWAPQRVQHAVPVEIGVRHRGVERGGVEGGWKGFAEAGLLLVRTHRNERERDP